MDNERSIPEKSSGHPVGAPTRKNSGGRSPERIASNWRPQLRSYRLYPLGKKEKKLFELELDQSNPGFLL